MKYLLAITAVLWLLTTAFWVANGQQWWVPLGAFVGTASAAVAEFQNESLRREVRRLSGRWSA